MRMDSQYRTDPVARPAGRGPGRSIMALLAVGYAVAAFGGPTAHVLEVLEGPALTSALHAPEGTVPADLPPDPAHDGADCLTCILLALSGDEPRPGPVEVEGPVTVVAMDAPAPPVASAAADPLPRLRGPPTA
jgi:hypothetical protein